jgi:hypothetical protein
MLSKSTASRLCVDKCDPAVQQCDEGFAERRAGELGLAEIVHHDDVRGGGERRDRQALEVVVGDAVASHVGSTADADVRQRAAAGRRVSRA